MCSQVAKTSPKFKWSEPIIVLGKGTPNFVEKYGCLMQCIAGVGEVSGWLRLYPVLVRSIIPSVKPIEKFDVIRTVFRVRRPEPLRPESRKIHPELVEKIGHIAVEQQGNILSERTEPGDFLHDDSWRGRRSLGLIEPKNPKFWVTPDYSLDIGSDRQLKSLERRMKCLMATWR